MIKREVKMFKRLNNKSGEAVIAAVLITACLALVIRSVENEWHKNPVPKADRNKPPIHLMLP